MKVIYFLVLTIIFAAFSACLEKYEIDKPHLTVTPSEEDIVYFSEIQTATFNVKAHCEEDIRFCKWSSEPNHVGWKDIKSFDAYTHDVDFNINLTHEKGYKIDSEDSTYTFTLMLSTDTDTCWAVRKLKYKYTYPEVDSFEVELSSALGENCLLDIRNKTTYRITEYENHNYDLVFINETRKDYYDAFGTAFVSPDAVSYLGPYFEAKAKNTDFSYGGENIDKVFRETKFGYIDKGNASNPVSWDNFSAKMLAAEDGWSYGPLNNVEAYGSGIVVDNNGSLYKAQLSDGTYAMFKITSMTGRGYSDDLAKIKMTVYFQK
ncbi:MAG: hypothetical protein II937_07355 [Bacteroidales bacterium]|nr:hypothetical protein [Bacteroidales bacterium]